MEEFDKDPASSAQGSDAERSPNITTKFNVLLTQIASTWLLTLGMALAHLLLCVRVIPLKCESAIVLLNARCAGTLLAFGCIQSLSVTLVSPLKVLHALLHYNVEAVKRDSDTLSGAIAVGNLASGIALLLMPLYGFYVCLGAMSCKQHAPSHHAATVVLSCIDSFIACGTFWAIVRGRDPNALLPLRKRDSGKVKATSQKSS